MKRWGMGDGCMEELPEGRYVLAADAVALVQEVRWLLETGTSGEHETVDPDEWESRKDALLREIGGKA